MTILALKIYACFWALLLLGVGVRLGRALGRATPPRVEDFCAPESGANEFRDITPTVAEMERAYGEAPEFLKPYSPEKGELN